MNSDNNFINTQGGAKIDGDVNSGHDFIGRDKITHNTLVVNLPGSHDSQGVGREQTEKDSQTQSSVNREKPSGGFTTYLIVSPVVFLLLALLANIFPSLRDWLFIVAIISGLPVLILPVYSLIHRK